MEIEILLDKINLLFASIKSDGKLDKFELALLAKYIQQLQDKVGAAEATLIAAPIQKPVVEEKKSVIPEPIIVKEEIPVKEEIAPPIIPITKIVEEVVVPKVKEERIPEPKIMPEKVDIPVEKKHDKKPIVLIKDDEVDEEEYNSGLNNKLFKDKKTIADKLSSGKEKDIKSLIDINDKLFFIKKLFKGDAAAYDQTLKTLNSMTDFNQASKLIEVELQNKFGWSNNEDVERLMEIVKTKFGI